MSSLDAGAGEANEQRKDIRLRMIFEGACRVTAPFFASEQGWGSASLTMYARQTLRDTYPELTQQELAILFSSVKRFHAAARSK